jgi:hypothetical protein
LDIQLRFRGPQNSKKPQDLNPSAPLPLTLKVLMLRWRSLTLIFYLT